MAQRTPSGQQTDPCSHDELVRMHTLGIGVPAAIAAIAWLVIVVSAATAAEPAADEAQATVAGFSEFSALPQDGSIVDE